MAEIVEYRLRVSGILGDKKEGDTEQKDATSSGYKNLSKMLHPIQSVTAHSKDEGAMVYFFKEMGKDAANALETVVNNSVTRYYQLSEDYIGQNNLNNIKANIGKAKSMGSSIISGATAGMTFGGPIGAVIGGISSGAMSGFKMYQDYKQQVFNYYNSMNNTNINTAYNAKRAGLYTGGKDTLG